MKTYAMIDEHGNVLDYCVTARDSAGQERVVRTTDSRPFAKKAAREGVLLYDFQYAVFGGILDFQEEI